MKFNALFTTSCLVLALNSTSYAAESERLSPAVKAQVEQTIQKCDARLASVSNKSALFTPTPKPNSLNLIAVSKWKKDSERLELMKKYYIGTWSEFTSFVNDHKIPLRVMADDRKAVETASTLIQSCNLFADRLDSFLKWSQNPKSVTAKDAQLHENAIQKEKDSRKR